jgi:hypothetical protein
LKGKDSRKNILGERERFQKNCMQEWCQPELVEGGLVYHSLSGLATLRQAQADNVNFEKWLKMK